MQVEVRALAASVNNLKIDLNGTISAYRILDAEVERDNPTSLGLAQARAIMSTAFNVAPSTTPTAHVPERRNNGERE